MKVPIHNTPHRSLHRTIRINTIANCLKLDVTRALNIFVFYAYAHYCSTTLFHLQLLSFVLAIFVACNYNELKADTYTMLLTDYVDNDYDADNVCAFPIQPHVRNVCVCLTLAPCAKYYLCAYISKTLPAYNALHSLPTIQSNRSFCK